MAVDLSSFGGVIGDLVKNLPTNNDIASQVATGAIASVLLAGLKSQAGQDALDPLHLIHPAGGSTVVGKSISSAAFNALSPTDKTAVLAAGYVIAG